MKPSRRAAERRLNESRVRAVERRSIGNRQSAISIGNLNRQFVNQKIRSQQSPIRNQPPLVCISRCASFYNVRTGMSVVSRSIPRRSSAPRSARTDHTASISRCRSSRVAPARNGRRRSVPVAAYRHSSQTPSAVRRLRSHDAQNGSVVDEMMPNVLPSGRRNRSAGAEDCSSSGRTAP